MLLLKHTECAEPTQSVAKNFQFFGEIMSYQIECSRNKKMGGNVEIFIADRRE